MKPAQDAANPVPRASAPHTEALLQGHSLGLQDQKRWIWRKLELAIAAGERVALTGPSGSGKTTLMRALAGLVPLTEGDLVLEQRPLQQWSMPDYRSRIAYLAQRPELGDGDTVEAVLSAPFQYRAHHNQEYPRNLIEQALQQLGRDPGFVQRPVGSLSGGEQQITALLRLLALQPALLLLDEPTAALDPRAALAVEQLLDAWQRETPGRAWLWSSHDSDQITRMCTRRIELP
ncbi:ABC transporter ATP-binding protein [Marinobacterium sedimentorum]|uniref:ABC transporter ATP-binding protein n=1 Tax=Marinobacterium sedimentorum TaxID=2927804 RepID=UPI0020C5C237|nr:ATP-binding cassette domain-containing protein [Marinobacterium sedimentorum]